METRSHDNPVACSQSSGWFLLFGEDAGISVHLRRYELRAYLLANKVLLTWSGVLPLFSNSILFSMMLLGVQRSSDVLLR